MAVDSCSNQYSINGESPVLFLSASSSNLPHLTKILSAPGGRSYSFIFDIGRTQRIIFNVNLSSFHPAARTGPTCKNVRSKTGHSLIVQQNFYLHV